MVRQLFLLRGLGSVLLGTTLGHGLSILHISRTFSKKISPEPAATHVSLVPLAEGGSVNLDDGALDKGVRANKLVVGSVVYLHKPIA